MTKIKNCFHYFLASTKNKDDPIPLPEISAATIKRIVAFCEKFEGTPEYVIPNGYISDPSPWLEALGDCEGDILVQLLKAANFLDIPRLIDAGLLKVKSFMDGQNIESIRGILNLSADLSPEEEQEIADKYVWNIIDTRDDNDSSMG
uniref:SKP1 component dimerisation domain-containing protein n=1 Tax=Panagrolaimus davidi TaxID=227884 RepID=A0A914QPZ5_9BILA